MFAKPSDFRRESFASCVERSEYRTIDRMKVGRPAAFLVRFDMRTAFDVDSTKLVQVNQLAVDAASRSGRFDDQFHHFAFRRMLRRGRSTMIPSSVDCTDERLVAICRRSESLSRSC